MSSHDQSEPSSPRRGEDDIIELTELITEESAETAKDNGAEVVVDLGASDDLSSLKAAFQRPPEPEAAASPTPPSESLDDFLASLPDLPEDLDVPLQSPEPVAPAAGAVPQELIGRLSEEDLRELVRQVVQETVERLAREMFPDLAAQALDRELNRWKKLLRETD
ncbi:MAG: hypothetical protein ACUVXF_03880 [Desulfobaccales bacterium]